MVLDRSYPAGRAESRGPGNRSQGGGRGALHRRRLPERRHRLHQSGRGDGLHAPADQPRPRPRRSGLPSRSGRLGPNAWRAKPSGCRRSATGDSSPTPRPSSRATGSFTASGPTPTPQSASALWSCWRKRFRRPLATAARSTNSALRDYFFATTTETVAGAYAVAPLGDSEAGLQQALTSLQVQWQDDGPRRLGAEGRPIRRQRQRRCPASTRLPSGSEPRSPPPDTCATTAARCAMATSSASGCSTNRANRRTDGRACDPRRRQRSRGGRRHLPGVRRRRDDRPGSGSLRQQRHGSRDGGDPKPPSDPSWRRWRPRPSCGRVGNPAVDRADAELGRHLPCTAPWSWRPRTAPARPRWYGRTPASPQSVAVGVRAALAEHGMQLVLDRSYPPDAADHNALAMAAKEAGADLFIGGGYLSDAVGLTKAAAALKVRPQADELEHRPCRHPVRGAGWGTRAPLRGRQRALDPDDPHSGRHNRTARRSSGATRRRSARSRATTPRAASGAVELLAQGLRATMTRGRRDRRGGRSGTSSSPRRPKP